MPLKNQILFGIIILITSFFSCSASPQPPSLTLGAERIDEYLPLLKGQRVGMVVNHTAVIGKTHLVDTLKSLGVTISAVFAPEHGFRGESDDGAKIKDGVDEKSGVEIRSVYGANRKPTEEMMSDIDVMLFDIQDVGARFYTFISTMHYAMEASAEKGIPFIVLDRPNPNGNYVDGPVREPEFKSFVGMHPIPIVHGLTVGELAEMINGEGWLQGGLKCDLTVIKMNNWTHEDTYQLPIKPSPNLPSQESIILYPSLCLFEGTVISVGRGTYEAFSQIGHPDFVESYKHEFKPVSIPGMSTYPKHQDVSCYGLNFMGQNISREFTLKYLLEFYEKFDDKSKFFNANNGFDRLAGTASLRKQISEGWTEEQIRESWEPELNNFKTNRKKYLLYP